MWGRSASRTVLIVAEEQAESALNTAFLHHPNIRLVRSYPNRGALRLARRRKPSLIIEDLQAPDHHGLEFCRDLRADPQTASIPLILVVDPELHEEAEKAEADALLDKPIVRRQYFEAVRRFLPLPSRRNQRVNLNLRLLYRVNGRWGQAFCRDFSQNGAFIKSDRPLPVGTHLEVQFSLPGTWEPMQCQAIVRSNSTVGGSHARLGGFGIEFAELDEDGLERLTAFIAAHHRRR